MELIAAYICSGIIDPYVSGGSINIVYKQRIKGLGIKSRFRPKHTFFYLRQGACKGVKSSAADVDRIHNGGFSGFKGHCGVVITVGACGCLFVAEVHIFYVLKAYGNIHRAYKRIEFLRKSIHVRLKAIEHLIFADASAFLVEYKVHIGFKVVPCGNKYLPGFRGIVAFVIFCGVIKLKELFCLILVFLIILKSLFVCGFQNEFFPCFAACGGNSVNLRLFFLGIGFVCDCAFGEECFDRRMSLEIWRNGYIGIDRSILSNVICIYLFIKPGGVYLALRHKVFIRLDKRIFVIAFACVGSLIGVQPLYKMLIAFASICRTVPTVVFRPIIAWVGNDCFAACDKHVTGNAQLYNIAAAIGFTVVCGEIKGLAAPIGKGIGIGAALNGGIFSLGAHANLVGQLVAVRIIEYIGKIHGVLKLFINACSKACRNGVSANRGSILAFILLADLNEDLAVIAVKHFTFCKCADKNRSIFIIGINFCSLKVVKIAIPFRIILHIIDVVYKVFKRNCIKAVFILCFKLVSYIFFRAFIGNVSIESGFAVFLYIYWVNLV